MGIIANYLCNGSVPSVVGGTGTSIKYFADLPAQAGWLSSNANVNTAIQSIQQGATPTATSNLGGLPVPGRSILNGQRFKVTASGNVLAGSTEHSGTLTITLALSTAASTSATPSYVTLLAPVLTPNLDSVYYPWTIYADLEGDTLSGILQG